MLDAAGRRAEEVIAASTDTVVTARFFDMLRAALERPPKANRAVVRSADGTDLRLACRRSEGRRVLQSRCHLVVRAELPRRIGRGSPDTIPAILLARLALDRTLHGHGLGGELLWDALSRTVAASRIAAARVAVVDAIDAPAARFYQHHGFVPVPGNAHRLVQKISDVAAAIEG